VFLELGVVPDLLQSLAHSDHRELIRNTTGAIANLASENGMKLISFFVNRGEEDQMAEILRKMDLPLV
jgi:hypothetical protein